MPLRKASISAVCLLPILTLAQAGGGGVGRVPERSQPYARRLAVGHLVVARRAEAAHSQSWELRASVQEHRHGWFFFDTSDLADVIEGA